MNLTGLGAAEPMAGPEKEVLESANEELLLYQDTLLNDLEDKYELETGPDLARKMNLDLADPAYKTRDSQDQSQSSLDVFSKRYVEDMVKLMCIVSALGAHGQMFCLNFLFHHWNRSRSAAKKEVETVEADLQKRK